MSAAGGHLAIRPELCDRCGRCVRVCPQGKLKVGAGFIYVDVSECTGCLACVDACGRGALAKRAPGQIVSRSAPGGKVLVGSRAEAKAIRQMAQVAEKSAHKRPPAKSAAPARPAIVNRSALPATPHVAWGSLDVAAVAAVLIASLVAKQTVLASAAFALMPPAGKVAARALALGVFYAVQLALLAFLARRHQASARDAFRLAKTSGDPRAAVVTAMAVFGLLVATRALSTLWGGVAQAAGWAPPATDALTGIFGAGGAGLLLAVVMVVLIAPFAEELAFRGVIAGALAERFGLWPAILGSAAVFSAYHLTAWVVVPTFVLGCALGWLAMTRRTLWPAIVLHALYNGVVVAAAFALPAR